MDTQAATRLGCESGLGPDHGLFATLRRTDSYFFDAVSTPCLEFQGPRAAYSDLNQALIKMKR